MELVSPGIGLIFWTAIAFSILLFILGKFAWKPIMQGLRERERHIDDALHAADKAREEMALLKIDNEKLMREAKEERDDILREARKVRESIIEDARKKSNAEADRIIEAAKETIENEKMAALTDLKNQIALLSLEIAEKVIREKLSDDPKQQALVERLAREVTIN